jgi:hypothetical protein
MSLGILCRRFLVSIVSHFTLSPDAGKYRHVSHISSAKTVHIIIETGNWVSVLEKLVEPVLKH